MIRHSIVFLSILFGQIAAGQERFVLPSRERDPNEVSVAISAINPAYVIAGSNIATLYVSADSGKTWRDTAINSYFGIWGDPVMLAHPDGNFLYAHLSKTPGKNHPHWIDRIVVQYSADNGRTWSDGEAFGHDGNKAQDKPWLSADAHRGSPFHGQVYMGWTEFDRYGSDNPDHRSRIRFTTIDSKGRPLDESGAIHVVSDREGDCLDGNQTPEGATAVALLSGRVLLAWAFDENIWLDISDDGGKTWGEDRVIAAQPGGWTNKQQGIYRANNMPFMAWTPGYNENFGRAWVGYGALDANGNSAIYLTYSDDGGINWTPPFEIPKPSGKQCDRFMPFLTADPITGELLVIYYDKCYSASNVFLDVSMFSLDNKADAGNQIRLTQGSFAPAGKLRFFGDYIGAASRDGVQIALWTEFRNERLQLAAWRKHSGTTASSLPIKPVLSWFQEEENLHYHISSQNGFKGKMIVRYKGLPIFNRNSIRLKTNDPDFEGTFAISGKNTDRTIRLIKLKSAAP